MLPWDFTRTAEGMLSRWAIKRLCKFLLKKKKLGDYIDLDQLDVQLSEGAIQLRDLALNVDFINQKLGETPVFVKEGTILSLSIRIPWRMKNCQIEVEELELVIAPCGDSCSLSVGSGTCLANNSEKEARKDKPENLDLETGPSGSTCSSLDVHEGVKTIAKIVKWFLTSFNIKVKNFIVAFDLSSERGEKGSTSHRSMVLRIAEIEYGTCVTEDAASKLNSLLGIAKLTNFIRFHRAVVEFLEMDEPFASDTSLNELYSKYLPSGNAYQVLSGAGGGFSGILNLSIPWKHGYLDIQKVDADISIEPLQLWLQPSTIKWILFSWQSLKIAKKVRRSHASIIEMDSVHQLYTLTNVPGCSRKIATQGLPPSNVGMQVNQMSGPGDSHSAPYIIQNWVTSDNYLTGHGELEPDYGASIDQFFECFDEMRSSQASLRSSGIWNLTCSVFNAITAASSLASESAHSPEQQYNKANVEAKVSAISVVLCFDDQNPCSQNLLGSTRQMEDLFRTVHDTFANPSCQAVNCVETKFQELTLTLQISANGMEVEATIEHINVDKYLNVGSESEKFSSTIRQLQTEIQCKLPPWHCSSSESDANSVYFSPNSQLFNEDSRENFSTIVMEGLVGVQLVESFGTCCCKYSLTSTNPNNKPVVSSSLSINLPQFIVWLDLSLVNMIMDLFLQVGNSLEDINKSISNVSKNKLDASSSEASGGTCLQTSTGGSFVADIFLPSMRIILCFPSGGVRNRELCCWSSFIGLDFSSISSSTKESCSIDHFPELAFLKGYSHAPSTSMRLHSGPLDVYLITTSGNETLGNESCIGNLPTFYSNKIQSITGGTDNRHPVITMLWQKGPVTGAWVANRAWSLATLKDRGNSRNVAAKGDGYVSVKKAEDLEGLSSEVRQEMILSSAFLIHIRLPQIYIDLSRHEYRLLYHLLNEVDNGFSQFSQAKDGTTIKSTGRKHSLESGHNASQAAIILECDLLDVRITLNEESIKVTPSLQKETAGTWRSLTLKINKFELLSMSSIGGISNENILWVSHDEGDLWGSVVNMDSATAASAQDLLLITCRNSVMKRGDGEGGNILCSGKAGTSIYHLSSQRLCQTFTSVSIRCATVIAPGGRWDWFGAICEYFSLPHKIAAENNISEKVFEDIETWRKRFLLDLVDVALSYEPFFKTTGRNFTTPMVSHSPAIQDDCSCVENIFCLLAAASLTLSNQATGNAGDNDYNIQIQDVGLLISEQSGIRTELGKGNYGVDCLQKAGYVKVVKEALIDAILRTNCQGGLLWEVEFSDLHASIGTCCDTTSGLICLISQLQQLFAPDVEDALVHLQSRWDALKQTHNEMNEKPATEMHSSVIDFTSSNEGQRDDANRAHTGLMDEILDDAFFWQGKQVDLCNFHHSLPKVRYDVDISSPAAGDLSLPNMSLNGTNFPRSENTLLPTEAEISMSQVIERYYTSDLLLQSTSSGSLSSKPFIGKSISSENRDSECTKSGWYKDSPLVLVEDHISDWCDNAREKFSYQVNEPPLDVAPPESCIPRGRIVLKNSDVKWRMYSGYDWPKTLKSSVSASSFAIKRDENVFMELVLSGLSLQYDFYPDGKVFVSKLSLSVQDFHLHDRSRSAPWKLILGYYHSKDHRRESSAKVIKLDLESVKPDPSIPLEEYRLRFSFLPVRLHLHQDQFNFLLNFFGHDTSIGLPPCSTSDVEVAQAAMTSNRNIDGQNIVEEALLPFFQKCEISPAVIRVDYIPHHVDIAALRDGNYVQLINLVPWKGIDIQLKPVRTVGIYGWGSVCETVVGEWLEDISRNQVHKILKGLTPVRSLYALSSGAAKLVSLPVKTYKKDHRLLKGIQRGALAFLRSVSLEAVGLGVHLAGGAHDLLIHTEHILTRVSPPVTLSQGSDKSNIRCNQPRNTRHGIQQAYESLTDGFGKTASALVGNPLKTYQRGAGAGSAFASAIRAAPVAAVAPASAVARALHCTLLGMRNSLDPERKEESMKKYLGSSES